MLGVCHHASFLPENQVDDPAPADVRALPPAVAEDLLVSAPGVHQGVGQDRQAVEGSVLVDGAGEVEDIGRAPTRVKSPSAERVAEDAAQEIGLRAVFGFTGLQRVQPSPAKSDCFIHGEA
jgi:hypothetical protein